jgi:putative spermidine/putrescine transport system permease protein
MPDSSGSAGAWASPTVDAEMTDQSPWLFRAATLLTIAALGVPLLLIAVMSFNSTPSLAFPPAGLSLRWYANIFATDSFLTGLAYSAYLAVVSSLIGVIVGTAAAFAIVRYRFWGRSLINMLVMAPLIIPEVVIGMSLLIWFSASGWGLSDASLLLLHSLIVLPYIVRIVTASLQRTDRNLEHAAMLLGAPPIVAVLRVTLPLIRNGIAAALIFALVISFQNFTATLFLVSKTQTLPVAIFGYIRTENDPTIAALSTLLIGMTAIIVWLTDRILGLERVT